MVQSWTGVRLQAKNIAQLQNKDFIFYAFQLNFLNAFFPRLVPDTICGLNYSF